MQTQTIELLHNTADVVARSAYPPIRANWQPIKLYWQMYQDKDLPPSDRLSVFTYLEVYTDQSIGTDQLYRARGNVVQEVLVPKRDGAYHDGIVYMSTLQDYWRKQRDINISYFDPMIYPSNTQPERKHLHWLLRVTYDGFETIN